MKAATIVGEGMLQNGLRKNWHKGKGQYQG
jgi:hypothetical protein